MRTELVLRSSLTALLCTQVMGSMLDDVIYKRGEYQENCTRFLKASLPTGTGIFCNGTFDVFACWPHSSPGIVSVPCPPYLPWIREGAAGSVYKECMINGAWKTEENSSSVWRNQSECENQYYFKSEEEEVFRQSVLRVLSIVGYSLSFSSLCLAVLIMSLLRKLHCTRNYIHMNLFVSFIFRATAVITKEVVLQVTYTNLPRDELGWNSYTKSAASKVSLEYFVGCNYFWLLVEAIFLHTLLFTAVLTRKRLLKKYMLIGWGTPLLFVIPWTVTKTLYENKSCWLNNIRWIWWIIRGPITLSVIVIFCIFLKIIRLLLSKLKADQVKFTDYRYSLARATLVLIPLLGIHEIVFTIIIDESVEGSNRYARNFVHLTLSSFQVSDPLACPLPTQDASNRELCSSTGSASRSAVLLRQRRGAGGAEEALAAVPVLQSLRGPQLLHGHPPQTPVEVFAQEFRTNPRAEPIQRGRRPRPLTGASAGDRPISRGPGLWAELRPGVLHEEEFVQQRRGNDFRRDDGGDHRGERVLTLIFM
ncbi:glucagon-like peptide 2 receptor isoform X2 [Pimephales promelas]|uniref:glucagon-like peptide 2 receptor isoform X2 n=1 Tax=Pimephales promelas TaxID=90988 RepID=UPI0019557D52|nr:glucagon-like peptide 2 receptor isoform X2 [Pimephales promelas]